MPLQFIRESREEIITRLNGDLCRTTFMEIVNLADPIAGASQLTVVDYVKNRTPWAWRPKYKYEWQPLLSNFQKAMRLRDVEQCLATALQLLSQDPSNFLRRLAVVLLEDAQLQPHLYAHIVWLMVATGKQYVLATEDVQLIVDAIATGLEAEERYDLTEDAAEEMAWFAGAEDTLRSAYAAIKIRAGAGGMRFDMDFLGRMAARLTAGSLPMQLEMSSVDLADVPEFTVAEHMLPAAIDFHCCPMILDAVKLQSGLKQAIIKEAIWWHRSSLNVRAGPAVLMAVESGQRFRMAQHWGQIAAAVSSYATWQLQLLEEKKVQCKSVKTLDSWVKRRKGAE